jgi:hypothetical protein
MTHTHSIQQVEQGAHSHGMHSHSINPAGNL